MFDRKCKDCIVLKRIKNAFVREELKNSELIIQNGKTYDDAIIINEQGKEILEFINNKRTVEEIINLMIQKYPEVEKDVVENDVYSFLYEGERREIIKVRGVEKMYKGHDIKRINDFEIYRCSEGDLKLIYKILNDQDTILDMRDYNTPEELYNAISIRAKVFMYVEDYYLLRKEDEIYGVISIVNGKVYINQTSFIGKIVLTKSFNQQVLKDFIGSVLINYKNEVKKDSKKIRISFENKDNFICAAQKELGITVANDFLPLVIRIAVLHLGQILKDAGNAEIPASDYTDFLIQFQDSSGVGKLISQYMYSNRKFSFFSILICITDQFDEDEGHKQGR